jgi:dihydrofolate reductase
MTRRVVVSEFVSLDGVIEDPGGAESTDFGGWTVPFWNEQLAAFKSAELFASDALLLGRKTYERFAAAWPSMADEAGFADRMNSNRKYVVSSTLQKTEWNNSIILGGNPAEDVARIVQEPGEDRVAPVWSNSSWPTTSSTRSAWLSTRWYWAPASGCSPTTVVSRLNWSARTPPTPGFCCCTTGGRDRRGSRSVR